MTLLIEKAREGKIVVRLKGGDRLSLGVVEKSARHSQKQAFVMKLFPGVSSAIAVPAYAGIPVTQRGVTTAFTVVAGHTGGSELRY